MNSGAFVKTIIWKFFLKNSGVTQLQIFNETKIPTLQNSRTLALLNKDKNFRVM